MIEKNTFKHLTVGLIYPAILGAILYEIFKVFGEGLLGIKKIEFLSDVPFLIFCKAILILSLLVFYICDFLYTTYTAKFRWWYFILDWLILFGQYVIFKGIMFENNALPNVKWIFYSFSVFMLLYALWDGVEFLSIKKGKNNKERTFYKNMVVWEGISLLCLIVLYAFFVTKRLSYDWILVYFTAVILLSTIAFVFLVHQKWALYKFHCDD